MTLNVKRLLNGETDVIDFDYAFPLEYTGIDYSFPEDVHVRGQVRNAGGYMPLEASCTVRVDGLCARCLKPVSTVLATQFSRTVATQLEEEDVNDEYLLVSQDQIEIGEPLRDELLLSLPSRLLCDEDCKGLCPKCGKDLNLGRCGCKQGDPDPRWAVLEKLKRNDSSDT